ncbi:hypothetical protein FOG51_00118 [Hanseniaspora uvarum]|nr:hypothetical protein FOG51_00118 [Hanseniaspora uvarum]
MVLALAWNKRFYSSRSYKDALNCLNSLQTNFKMIQDFKKNKNAVRKTDQAIDEMKEYMYRLGYGKSLKEIDNLNCIHITGTKGKGSTAAFVNSILLNYSKYVDNSKINKIGLYTSPHLKTCRERIRINGEPISEQLFTKYFFEVWDGLNSTTSDEIKFPDLKNHKKPGYFKFLTLLSFHVFVQEKCNTCVYEVGIGGKYDSTNIINNPTSTGISLLGIDHVNVLGDTVLKICDNKIGIFKKNANNFSILGQPETEEVFGLMQKRLETIGSEEKLNLIPVFDQLDSKINKAFNLGINGDFQKVNASLATALSINHINKIADNKIPIEFETKNGSNVWDHKMNVPDFIKDGLQECKWEGRCQTIKDTDFKTWYLDGAHTIDSIQKSTDWFVQTQVNKSTNSHKKTILYFNQQSREDHVKEFLEYINTATKNHKIKFDEVLFSTNKTWSEGYSTDLVSMNVDVKQVDALTVQKRLKDIWLSENNSENNVKIFDSIEDTYKYIKQQDGEVDVFVTGSLHLVGGLLVVMDGK